MTSPLDEKGLGFAAIEMAKLRGMSCLDEVDQRMYGADAARIIRAYLSTATAPDELGVVIEAVGEAIYGRHERGFVMWPLVDGDRIKAVLREHLSQAHSTIAALRRDHELVVTLRNQVEAAHRQLDAAEAEVKRLTEENEALRAERGAALSLMETALLSADPNRHIRAARAALNSREKAE